ncbi:MAG: class I SAM-dependent methyltransferase [Gemmatimonadales bacterium]|nr:MAG: class I SAM-dependent methyltransferase [Gemmatimonadales bacterium]
MNEREYALMFSIEEEHWWYVALHELVVRCVAREAAQRGPLTILDAGCGTGRLCQLLQPFGRVSGCDLAEPALAFCRQRGIEVFAADLNEADLGTARFDVITSIDVLYHQAIRDDAPVLASLFRALKPGGLLILNLVAFEFLRSTHDLAVHTRERYTRPLLEERLSTAGFTVEIASYRLAPLFPLIALIRLVKRLLHGSRSSAAEVASDVSLPSPRLNRLLLGMLRLENRLIDRLSLPFGTSLFAVARKPLEGTP